MMWATEISALFSESAKMTTHDGQRYQGRDAVIRRLNNGTDAFNRCLTLLHELVKTDPLLSINLGIEQFMKIVGRQEGLDPTKQLRSTVHISVDHQGASLKGGAAKSRWGLGALAMWAAALLREGSSGSKQSRQPTNGEAGIEGRKVIVAVYTFT